MAKIVALPDDEMKIVQAALKVIAEAGGDAILMSHSSFEALENKFSQRNMERTAKHFRVTPWYIESVSDPESGEFVERLTELYGD